MRTLTLYRMSVFFVAFAATLALAVAEGRPTSPLLFLALCPPLWWARNRKHVLPPRTRGETVAWNAVFASLAFVFTAMDLTWPDPWYRVSVLYLVFILFTARRSLSYTLAYLLSFLMVLVASFAAPSPYFLLILLYFLFMTGFSLVLHHFMRDMRRRLALMDAPDPRADPLEMELAELPAVNRLFFHTLRASMILLAVALPIFFLLPRAPGAPEEDSAEKKRDETPRTRRRPPPLPPVPPGFDGSPGTGSDEPTHPGFSGSIDLGSWGVLFESEREMLRVLVLRDGRSLIPDLAGFTLRGVVLEHFDGIRWTQAGDPPTLLFDGDDGRRDGLVTLLPHDPAHRDLLSVSVTARRELGPVRFHAPDPVAYEGSLVYRDAGNALWARTSGVARDEVEAYTVRSIPPALSPALLKRLEQDDGSSLPPSRRALALPRGVERVAALARRLGEPGDAPWVTAQSFVNFLRGACRYSKERFDPPPDRPPLDVFLFERRAGHCELFASTLAVMLRARGIPARVVGGFRGGTVQAELDESYISVRESDAHAWVEAWFGAAGAWIPLDPTPGSWGDTDGDPLVLPPSPDAPEEDWVRFLVRYDQQRQGRLLRRSADAVGAAAGFLASGFGFLLEGVPAPLLAVGALAVAAALTLVLRRRRRALDAERFLGRAARGETGRSLSFYVEALRALRALGFVRKPAQTPAEFARAVLACDASLGAIGPVTDMFQRIRYGEDRPGPEELEPVRLALRELKGRAGGARSRRSSDPPRP